MASGPAFFDPDARARAKRLSRERDEARLAEARSRGPDALALERARIQEENGGGIARAARRAVLKSVGVMRLH